MNNKRMNRFLCYRIFAAEIKPNFTKLTCWTYRRTTPLHIRMVWDHFKCTVYGGLYPPKSGMCGSAV